MEKEPKIQGETSKEGDKSQKRTGILKNTVRAAAAALALGATELPTDAGAAATNQLSGASHEQVVDAQAQKEKFLMHTIQLLIGTANRHVSDESATAEMIDAALYDIASRNMFEEWGGVRVSGSMDTIDMTKAAGELLEVLRDGVSVEAWSEEDVSLIKKHLEEFSAPDPKKEKYITDSLNELAVFANRRFSIGMSNARAVNYIHDQVDFLLNDLSGSVNNYEANIKAATDVLLVLKQGTWSGPGVDVIKEYIGEIAKQDGELGQAVIDSLQ